MDWIKTHPALAAGLLLGGAVFIMIVRNGSASAAPSGPSAAAINAAASTAQAASAERIALATLNGNQNIAMAGFELDAAKTAIARDISHDYQVAQVNMFQTDRAAQLFAIRDNNDTAKAIAFRSADNDAAKTATSAALIREGYSVQQSAITTQGLTEQSRIRAAADTAVSSNALAASKAAIDAENTRVLTLANIASNENIQHYSLDAATLQANADRDAAIAAANASMAVGLAGIDASKTVGLAQADASVGIAGVNADAQKYTAKQEAGAVKTKANKDMWGNIIGDVASVLTFGLL